MASATPRLVALSGKRDGELTERLYLRLQSLHFTKRAPLFLQSLGTNSLQAVGSGLC